MRAIETAAIQRFLDAVKRATQARARDVRVEIADATVLASEVAVVLARLAALENAAGAAAPNAATDGGTFR